MNAYIFFVNADLRALWKVAKRHRAARFPFVCGLLATVLLRSKTVHVAIGDGDTVGSCSAGWSGTLPQADYTARNGDYIAGHFKVRLASPIRVANVASIRPVTSLFPSLLAHLTFGRFPCHNCVTVVSDLLREGGIDVPRGTYSPKQLHKFLEERGCRWVSKPH